MSALEKSRGLGRGLNALFGDDEADMPQAYTKANDEKASELSKTYLNIAQLVPGKFQPRRHFDPSAIDELAASIETHGVIQPLLVRPLANSMYEIIAGERRWRAAQRAQLHQIPVIIRAMGNQDALEIGLIENLQREDLDAIEESRALKQLVDEFAYNPDQIASKIGKSRPYVANMLRLSELSEPIAIMVQQGALSAGHARALLSLEPNIQLQLAEKIAAQHLNVRQAEKLVASMKPVDPEKATASLSKKISKALDAEKDVNTLSLEREISNVLGMSVEINMADQQTGSLQVRFKTLDQLDDVLQRLSINPNRQSRY